MFKRYIQILTMIPSYGIRLRELETKISKEYGVSINQAYKYIQLLEREGLVYKKRAWKHGPIEVRVTPEAKRLILQIVESWKLI